MEYKLVDLSTSDEQLTRQAAQLMVDAFRAHWPNAWPTLTDGLEEVRALLEPEHICRAALDENGNLLGLIGGNAQYDGRVWELHPLAVRPEMQGQGVGRALIEDFEAQVKARGGLTITLGTDDEDGMTSLSGADLYENTWEKIAHIRNLKGHPFTFYRKVGYTITGVVPDANGIGKPDILMSKRVG
jgi:aminoglycoside 6'-N-acetyltransferase I